MILRKYTTLAFLLLFTFTACSPKTTATPLPPTVAITTDSTPAVVVEPVVAPENGPKQFDIISPYAALNEETIVALGADGFSGTDMEIANAIIAWQGENMQYIGDPNVQADISHPMRWNYFLPGIFPVEEMVAERRLENGKIYGLCWDFASIFNAIAGYYGLDSRVSAYKVYMSDENPMIDKSTANGMSYEEYQQLLPKLEKHGLTLSYDQISRAARETWIHYRAEVKIDGAWVAFDGSPNVSAEFAAQEYNPAPWDEGYDANLLYPEVERAQKGMEVDLNALMDLMDNAPADGYQGITDDAGDGPRAANLADFFSGKALLPYYKNIEDVVKFLEIAPTNFQAMLAVAEMFEKMDAYEAGTGKHFYVIADLLIYTTETMSADEYVPFYNAFTGSKMTMDEFASFIE